MLERVRSIAAPRGTGSLLCLSPSPHDRGATLAASGEGGACVVLDLRGDALVAHRLAADAGCFRAGDAVSAVLHDPANAHALYCASGRVATRWDLRHLPTPANPIARAFGDDDDDAPAASSSFPAASSAAASSAAASSPLAPLRRFAHNTDEINTLAVTAEGDALCAADDAGDVVVVDLSGGGGGGGGGGGATDSRDFVRVLRGGHGARDAAIASAAAFRDRPRDERRTRGDEPRTLEVLSGGFDCCVRRWDASFTREGSNTAVLSAAASASPLSGWHCGDVPARRVAAKSAARRLRIRARLAAVAADARANVLRTLKREKRGRGVGSGRATKGGAAKTSGSFETAEARVEAAEAAAVRAAMAELGLDAAALAEALEPDTDGSSGGALPPGFNPPYVHALAVANAPTRFGAAAWREGADRLVAAACGDGTVFVADVAFGSGGTERKTSVSDGFFRSETETIAFEDPFEDAEGDDFGSGGARSRRSPAGGGGGGFGGGGGGARSRSRSRAWASLGAEGEVGGRSLAHAASASAVAFPSWGRGAMLLSGGNDRAVKLWDLSAIVPRFGEARGAGDGGARVLAGSARNARKVNALASRGEGEVFVADTSESVKAYVVRE